MRAWPLWFVTGDESSRMAGTGPVIDGGMAAVQALPHFGNTLTTLGERENDGHPCAAHCLPD